MDIVIPDVVASQVSVVQHKPIDDWRLVIGDFDFGLAGDTLDGLGRDGEAGAGDNNS